MARVPESYQTHFWVTLWSVFPTNIPLRNAKCWFVTSIRQRENLSLQQNIEPLTSKTTVGDLNTELPRDSRWPRPLYQCKFTCSTARISDIESVMWYLLSHHASTTSIPYQNSLLPDRSVHIHTGFESYLEKSCPSQDHNTANTQNAKKIKIR